MSLFSVYCNEGQQVQIKGGKRNMCYQNQGDEPQQGQTNADNQSKLQDIEHTNNLYGLIQLQESSC